MSLLRDLLAGRAGRRSGPDPVVVVRDVGHRVFIERVPEDVWLHLVEPDPGAELGVDCVRVLPLPGAAPGQRPELAAVWRRPNGRLWVGLGTVDVEPGVRVVARATDGGVALALTTTLEPLDGGCVVAQQLEGIEPTDPVAEFARAWMARALLGLKADVEGTPRSRTRDPLVADPLGAGLGEPLGEGPGAAGLGGGVVPVHESASVEVAVTPDRLWQLLDVPDHPDAPAAGEVASPSVPGVERLVRVELADEPGREHVLAVHGRPDGRRAASVRLVVESTPPARIVERDLTSAQETDMVTTVEPCDGGARLTETYTGWLPSGPGHAVDSSGIAVSLRSRLTMVKQLAEAGAPPRDPRTGFLPPDQSEAPPPLPPPAESAPPAPLPSSVLLPPPHVAAPAAGHDVGPWLVWGDEGFSVAADATWW